MYDVCVIGTGAGGGVWIDACTHAGLDVVALERGPQLGPKDFLAHTELTNIVRGSGFAPDWQDTSRENASQQAQLGRSTMLAQCVGGGTVHWGAWAWRLREDDFHVLSAEGPVEGASLADWPFSYEELAPYYDAAELRLGMSGTAGANPSEAPRKVAYPNPPHPPRAATLKIQAGAKKLGLHPFPTPLAINSRPYRGRGACINGGMCANFGCPVHAKASSYAIHLRDARATGKLDLRAETRVVELMTDKGGHVRAARTLDTQGNEQEVRARHFVLAAGGIGSAHLLLSSRSARHPDGLANGSGLVGRNLMFHKLIFSFMDLPEPTLAALGTNGMVAVDDWHASDSTRGFIRGAVVGEAPEPSPIWASAKAQGSSAQRFGRHPGTADHLREPPERSRASELLPGPHAGAGRSLRRYTLVDPRHQPREGRQRPHHGRLPHGQGPGELGRRRRVPQPRGAESLHLGRELLPHLRWLQPDAHHLRNGRPGGRSLPALREAHGARPRA
jgi:choline dehydrogenase-like flavoprotein